MSVDTQRVDFNVNEFETLITQKGLVMAHEKAVACSCRGVDGQADPLCTVCLGTGWRYISAGDIKAIVTGISKETELTLQGFEATGAINVTTFAENRLAYRDRLILNTGKVVYTEVIKNHLSAPVFRYPIVDFEMVMSLTKEYVRDVDYAVSDAGVFSWITTPPTGPYSVRYITRPSWLIINFPNVIRATLTRRKMPTISYVELPVHAVAKLEFMAKSENA